MLRRLLPLILCCLPLWGCAAGIPQSGTRPPERAGAVRRYPLELPEVTGILPFAGGAVVFCGEESGTRLVLLAGDDLHRAAETRLDFPLSPGDASLAAGEEALSYYDPLARQTVVLDSALELTACIAAPDDMTGDPILSADLSTLYYTSKDAVRAWDLESGIRRSLRQGENLRLAGLHMEGTVLECRAPHGSVLLLSSENGELLHHRAGDLSLSAAEGRYQATFPAGLMRMLVFGWEETVMALFPADLTAIPLPLPEQNAAVTLSGESVLDYYDLTTGLRISRLSLTEPVHSVHPLGGDVLVLCREEAGMVMYRWDPEHPDLAAGDIAVYTAPCSTAQAPDTAALARCRDRADALGREYGIQVLIWQEAAAAAPWDYTLTPEHLAPVLSWQLDRLEAALSAFPETVIRDTAAHYGHLRICLVRSLSGTAGEGSLDTALGLHYLADGDAYILLAADKLLEQTFCHELFHVMEPHIRRETSLLEQWELLNPEGFSYSNSYTAPPGADAWLTGGSRCFVDRYSMSYATEDRARILEYAMSPGHRDVFASRGMQAKLEALCRSIRESYGLDQGPFLWEQYLEKGL